MAGESTYVRISHLLPVIWEQTLWFMKDRFVMANLVKLFGDTTTWVDREVDEYMDDSEAVQDSLAETDDLTAIELIRELKSKLSPKEIGKQYKLYDRRMESEASLMARAVQGLGYSLGKKVERDLMSNLANLQGGSYGSASNRMALDLLYWGRTKLEGANVVGPYYTVLHPYQYRDLFKQMTNLANASPLEIQNTFQRQYYVTQIADFQIVVSPNVPRVMTTGAKYSVDLGGATGGTYNLVVNGQVTADIAYNAVEAAITTALEALSNVGVGDIVVDTDAPTDDVDLTMANLLINQQPKIDIISKNLTGYTTIPRVYKVNDGAGYFAGGMWSREALALDIRRGLRIEPDRDPSGRYTELNATMGYAHGLWHGEKGVCLKSQATLSDPTFPS